MRKSLPGNVVTNILCEHLASAAVRRYQKKKKKEKRKKQDGEMGLQATVWDPVGPEDTAFTCIHCL